MDSANKLSDITQGSLLKNEGTHVTHSPGTIYSTLSSNRLNTEKSHNTNHFELIISIQYINISAPYSRCNIKLTI